MGRIAGCFLSASAGRQGPDGLKIAQYRTGVGCGKGAPCAQHGWTDNKIGPYREIRTIAVERHQYAGKTVSWQRTLCKLYRIRYAA